MPPPTLTLQNLQNRTVTLSDFTNKPTILAFIASWSGSCQNELAALNEISKAYKSKGLNVVAVSLDKTTKALEEYVAANKVDFEILVDKKLKSLDKFAVLIIPTTFMIGKDGKIANVFVDYDDNVQKSMREFVRDQTLTHPE